MRKLNKPAVVSKADVPNVRLALPYGA
jgi:ribosomal protein L35